MRMGNSHSQKNSIRSPKKVRQRWVYKIFLDIGKRWEDGVLDFISDSGQYKKERNVHGRKTVARQLRNSAISGCV